MVNDLRRWMTLVESHEDEEDDNVHPEDDADQEDYTLQPAYLFQRELKASLTAAGLDGVCEVITREEDRETVELYQITTNVPDRKQGHANRAMMILTDLADKFDVWLTLEASANMDATGMPTDRLVKWYNGWGFDETSTGMMRKPQA